MSENPLVSVCMPAFNAERYLSAALDSILSQSYQNIEIIVVNDGSTDKTAEVLKEYEVKGVRGISQSNAGQCAAANRAYLEAKGEYIKFFDADDLLSPDFIKNQVERLNGRKDAIASAGWGRFPEQNINEFRLNPESVWRDMKPIDWIVESLWEGPNMMQCALWLIPREILNKAGLWDERLSLINDFDFIIRVLLASNDVLFTENATLYYRSSIGSSLSGQKSHKAYASAFLSTELGVKTLIAFEDSARTRKVAADSFQVWKFQFYPVEMDLYKQSEDWIKKLGGSDYPFPSGGITRTLSKLIGWKLTTRLKSLWS